MKCNLEFNIETKIGKCDRCGKEKEVIVFQTLPNKFCKSCAREIIKRKIRREFKGKTAEYCLEEYHEEMTKNDERNARSYENIIDFIKKSIKAVEFKEEKCKDKSRIITLINQDIIDSLFLYALFYNHNLIEKIKDILELKLPLRHISFEEINFIFGKEIMQEYCKNTVDHLDAILGLTKGTINKSKLLNIISKLTLFSEKYRGIIQSTLKSIEKLNELGLLEK